MKTIDHSLEGSVNGITSLPDIERAIVEQELNNQPNPPSDKYKKDFMSSSIDG